MGLTVSKSSQWRLIRSGIGANRSEQTLADYALAARGCQGTSNRVLSASCEVRSWSISICPYSLARVKEPHRT
jgi:hypothetical protein